MRLSRSEQQPDPPLHCLVFEPTLSASMVLSASPSRSATAAALEQLLSHNTKRTTKEKSENENNGKNKKQKIKNKKKTTTTKNKKKLNMNPDKKDTSAWMHFPCACLVLKHNRQTLRPLRVV